MFIEIYDDNLPAVVWLFTGSNNVPDDHQRWLSSMARCDQAFGRRRGVGVLIIDDGNPSPSPEVREQITSVARTIRGSAPLAVVTSSSLARTVIFGLDVTGVVSFAVKGFAAVEPAVQWLARPAVGGADAVMLLELVGEARARAVRQV